MNDGRSGGKNRESCGGGGPAGQSIGDGFAYLLRGQPAALADELPLHLSNERHRPTAAEEPEAQEMAYEWRQMTWASVGVHSGLALYVHQIERGA